MATATKTKPKPQLRSVTLTERVATDTSGRVDRTNGVIRGVKVLGKTSKNGRTYTDAALRKAVRLYEDMGCFVDHAPRSNPNAERKLADRVGWLSGVHVKADGIYADLNILKSHPNSGAIFEAAERNPGLLGLSHNAGGKSRYVGGRNVVEAIEMVRSVDIVTSPATTRGLFESVDSQQANRGSLTKSSGDDDAGQDDGTPMGAYDLLREFVTKIENILSTDGAVQEMSVAERIERIGELAGEYSKLVGKLPERSTSVEESLQWPSRGSDADGDRFANRFLEGRSPREQKPAEKSPGTFVRRFLSTT